MLIFFLNNRIFYHMDKEDTHTYTQYFLLKIQDKFFNLNPTIFLTIMFFSTTKLQQRCIL